MSVRLCLALMVLAVGVCVRGVGAQEGEKAPAAEARVSPEAQAVLDRVRAHYSSTKSVSVKVTMARTTGAAEMEDGRSTIPVIAAAPNRLMVRMDEAGVPAYIVACDGTTLSQYIGSSVNKYSSDKAPETFAGILAAASGGHPVEIDTQLVSPFAVLIVLDPGLFDQLIRGAERVTYSGREQFEGRECERIRIHLKQLDADVLVHAEGEAWVARILPDLSKMFAGLDEQLKTQIPRIEYSFTEWAAKDNPDAQMFVFTPPEGAEKVGSLMEAMGADMNEEGGHAALLGKPAPEIALDLLDGGKATLADHKGKNVVVLDFWATWCPPCVKGLPTIAKVTAAMKDQGVVFYAVNEQEPVETIRAFLEKRKLAMTVALDPKGKAGQAYGVSGIPQTVLIGRDGTVQAIHVGLSPNLEEELTRELKTLLENKPLFVAGAEGAHEVADPDEPGAENTKRVWSVAGSWTGVDTDPATGDVYGMRRGGRVVRLDRNGKEIERIALKQAPQADGILRLANLSGDAAPELLTFTPWVEAACAFDAKGERMWEYALGDGVDDARAADLDGDGLDEVIIGYNGSTGLHVLDGAGKERWKFTDISNVWHVTAGPTGEGGAMQVITTSAGGIVHIFDTAGKKVRDVRMPGYANLVRLAHADGKHVLVVTLDNGAVIAGVDLSGKELWRAPLSGKKLVSDGESAPNRPWFAAAARTGEVLVFDVLTGRRIASLRGGESPTVTWIPSAAGIAPLLIVASADGLSAHQILEVAAGDAPDAVPEAPKP